MEKLSIKQKIQVVILATKSFNSKLKWVLQNDHSSLYDYPLLCVNIAQGLRTVLNNDSIGVADIRYYLPELLKYRPEGFGTYDTWWAMTDYCTRQRVLAELKASLMSKLTWYDKLYDQFKNLFK